MGGGDLTAEDARHHEQSSHLEDLANGGYETHVEMMIDSCLFLDTHLPFHCQTVVQRD